MDDRQRYVWLKLLTILGPTVFVAIGEYVREEFLRELLAPFMVNLIAIAATLLAAVIFSWYMFRALESMETERRSFKEALLSLKERERLAREMHDGLSQNLAVLKLEAYKLRELSRGQEDMAREMEIVDQLINQTYLEVRQTLYDLRASARLDEGFWTTIDNQMTEFRRQTNIGVSFKMPSVQQEPWGQLASVQILRIIQEALTNVRKHSDAHSVRLEYVLADGAVQFTLCDDGCGFDVQNPKRDHYGLQVMRERAETIGGWLAVESQPGKGTTVTLVVPWDRGRGSGQGQAHVGG